MQNSEKALRAVPGGAQDGYEDRLTRVSNEYRKLREEYMKLLGRVKAQQAEQVTNMTTPAGAGAGAASGTAAATADRDAIAGAIIEAERAARQIVDNAKYEAYRTAESAKKQCEAYEARKEKAVADLGMIKAHVVELVKKCESLVV
jgi:hypothetical protein